MTLRAPKTTPATVIGGYLGAGKTTLVNHLLRNARGRRIAVLVNEFGALPIDADLIEGADDRVLAIAGGCICCAFGDDLVATLTQVASREDVDQILIETSGVALPGAIVRTLQLVPALAHEATLVVVDAETVRAQASDKYLGDTILRQLADADLVIVNKIDLAPRIARADLGAWLAEVAPRARIIEADHAAVDPSVALGVYDETRRFIADAPDAAHEAGRFASLSLTLPDRLDVERLAARLASGDVGLARAKGFARDEHDEWKAFQIVGRRFEITNNAPRDEHGGRLVCIAQGRPVDQSIIEEIIVSCAR